MGCPICPVCGENVRQDQGQWNDVNEKGEVTIYHFKCHGEIRDNNSSDKDSDNA